MIGTKTGIFNSGGKLLPEYINYLQRLQADGISLPSSARQDKDNAFVAALLGENTYSTSIWNKIYLLQVWSQEVKNQIIYNWQEDISRPSYTDYAKGIFINSGGIFSSGVGYNPNASEPINSKFIPNTHISGVTNDFEIWFYNKTSGINFGWDFGALGTGVTTLSIAYQSWNGGATFNSELQIGASTADYASADENNLLGAWRAYINSSGYIQLAKNGVNFGMRDAIDAPTAKATAELFFGSINNGGSPLFMQNRQKSMYIITDKLTSTEANALLECIVNYEASL